MAGERTAVIGVDELYVARMTNVEKKGTLPNYDAPRWLPGVRNISVTPRTNSTSWYDDNNLWRVFNCTDGADLSIERTMLSDDDYAYLMNEVITQDGEIEDGLNTEIPYFAVMYRRTLDGTTADGRQRCRYVTLFKWRPNRPDEKTKGMENQTTPQPDTLTGTVLPLESVPGKWRRFGDNTNTGFTAEKEALYFSAVRLPGQAYENPGIIGVDKLPDQGRVGAIYVLTADDGERLEGTMWSWTTNGYEQYYKIAPVKALPAVATADINTVYVLLDDDGERTAGSKWMIVNGEWSEYLN